MGDSEKELCAEKNRLKNSDIKKYINQINKKQRGEKKGFKKFIFSLFFPSLQSVECTYAGILLEIPTLTSFQTKIW